MCLLSTASVLTWVAVLTRALLLAVVCAVLTGCALHDRRDAAWDPQGGRQLIDQIPAWEGATLKQCGDYTNGRVPRC
jgi:outer membrane biogenesis lipoprotein LolB